MFKSGNWFAQLLMTIIVLKAFGAGHFNMCVASQNRSRGLVSSDGVAEKAHATCRRPLFYVAQQMLPAEVVQERHVQGLWGFLQDLHTRIGYFSIPHLFSATPSPTNTLSGLGRSLLVSGWCLWLSLFGLPSSNSHASTHI